MNKHKHHHLRVSDIVRQELKDELNDKFVSLIEKIITLDIHTTTHLPVGIMRDMNEVLNQIHKEYSKKAFSEYARAYRSVIEPIRYRCGYGHEVRI